jgi:membrane protein DedA with SNARE-associated domain
VGGTITAMIDGLASTSWVYLVLFVIAAVDGFLPLVPAETLVITLGAWAAATGEPHVAPLVLLAALGAFTGDHISYAIGRRAGDRIFRRRRPRSRARRLYDRIDRLLEQRGGLALVVARYIPGGRTAATLTTGATRFPRARFTRYVAIAAVSWAAYATALGYLGGAAFQEEPLKGVALGLGIAIAITVVHEAVHAVRHRGARFRGASRGPRLRARGRVRPARPPSRRRRD